MKRLLMLGSGSYKSTLTIRLRDLARHLSTRFDVTMMTPPADKYNNFTPDYSLRPKDFRLVQPWQLLTHSPILNLIPYLFTSLWVILASRADIMYLYKPTPITVLGLIPRLWGRTVVLDMDDLGSEVMKLEGQSKLNVWLVAACERLSVRYSSAVVVASTYLESIIRAKYPNKRILVLPNGVEPSDYADVAETKPRHGVYFFGGMNRLELMEDLLHALPAVVKAVPDVRVTIAGGGSALDDVKKLAHELGVDQHVTFTGWLNDMLAVQAHTHFADLGVCYQPDTQTVRAASNMKVFQYMAMHTVPVVSDVGDLRQYVRDGNAGVAVKPDDAAELAHVLIELLRDDARRIALAHEASRLARSEYSWQARAEHVATFISAEQA